MARQIDFKCDIDEEYAVIGSCSQALGSADVLCPQLWRLHCGACAWIAIYLVA